MAAALATLFKSLFSLVIGVLLLIVVALAWVTLHRAGGAMAAGVLLAGVAMIVAVFGVVALQIENNALLRRIAEAVEEGAPASAQPERLTPVHGAEPFVRGTGGRVEPVLRAPRADPPVVSGSGRTA